MALRDGEDGTVSAFAAVLTLALLAVAGLAYDGGQIVTTTAHARELAGAAARAGAQEPATGQVHAGRSGLDPAAARTRASEVIAAADATGTVSVDGDTVRVSVTATQPMRILPLSERRITVTSTATAVSDVLAPEAP